MIDPSIIDALAAAGASAEMIAAAYRADYALETQKSSDRRAIAAAKKRRQRGVMSPDVPGTDGDEQGQPGTIEPPSPSPPSPPPMITKNSTPTTTPTTSSGNSTARGSRLPDGWRPDEAGRALASELLGNSGARAELEKFTDFWRGKAGADGRKVDWDATWRNWVRHAAERSPAQARASPGKGRFSADPYIDALAEAVDHERKSQFAHD